MFRMWDKFIVKVFIRDYWIEFDEFLYGYIC